MNRTTLELDVSRVCDLIDMKKEAGTRIIVGISGPPASGKSSLAEAIVQSINHSGDNMSPEAALLPMDGYHLDNRLLESRGLLARKGAPETFNEFGFCEAIRRLSTTRRETFHPRFDRQMDLSIANAIVIHPDTKIIIVEGNYLFLDRDPWRSLKDIFAATVFVSPPIEALRDRLRQRWINHGLDPEAAALRATNNDLVNAELVVSESYEADLTLTQNYTEFGVRYAY